MGTTQTEAAGTASRMAHMSRGVAELYDAHIASAVRFAYLVSGDDALAQDLAHDEMRRALDLLPPRRRAAVVLRYYEDMTERQTADVLGCSVPAVKALVARGLETLRTALEGDPE